MRIFVTGGTGIVGRFAVPLLRDRGHDVTVLTRDASKCEGGGVVQGDIADTARVAEALARCRPDAALHLAWEGLPDYSLAQTLRNVELSLQFFRLASEAGCRSIVSTGSCWEYAARHGRIDEEAPLSAAQPFHAAKTALRFLGQSIAQAHDAQFYWLRLFFVYGPGQRPQSLIPQVIQAMREGREPQLHAPHNCHDFVYVTDVARAIADVIEQRPSGNVYNVGSGYRTPVADVVGTARRLLGESRPWVMRPGDPEQDFWANISRLEHDTGWRPTVDLEAGLRQILRT